MSTIKTRSSDRNLRDDNRYLELVRQFPLRPIRTKRDYATATKVMERLAIRGEENLDADELDYLEVLTDLVEAYDDEHFSLPEAATPRDRLEALMEEARMSTADLGRLIGNSGLASQILLGRRQLSKNHIRILSQHFKLDAGYFL